MDQFQLILAKLTTFSDNLQSGAPLRAIDRDMLKRYIQDLYDAVPQEVISKSHAATEMQAHTHGHNEEVVAAVHTKLRAEAPVAAAVEQITTSELPANADEKMVEVVEKEVIEKQSNVPTTNTDASFATMDALTEEVLSQAPSYAIPKINASFKKVFGLNDKFQITSVLFDGDNETFLESLKALDNAKSMDEMKAILAPFAEQYNWADPAKDKVVSSFIQTVAKKFS